MGKTGLTISSIFEAESANYTEGIGNVSILKKIGRNDRNQYTMIARQAIDYNLIRNAGWDNTPVALSGGGKKVIQYAPDATIMDYPEIDLFGYMKTTSAPKKGKKGKKGNDDEDTDTEKNNEKGTSSKRAAVVRVSNAIAMEPFNGDFDYMTNMGLQDRLDEKNTNSIVQSEIHKSFYTYTVTIDLDKVGIDGDLEIEDEEKANRVKTLLNQIEFLYRDIRGRRENMSPVFIIGGVYERKNPYFENRLKFSNKYNLATDCLTEIMEDTDVKNNTAVGCLSNIFSNEDEIKVKLPNVSTINTFFNNLKAEVDKCYE